MTYDYQQFVPQVQYELIPIKNLVSNQDYQRNLSIKHVQKAAAHFDIYQVNPIKVSRREGINYVFNGQHTIEIIALVSGSRETPVWCMVYDDLEYMQEAGIFANQMKYTRPLSPYEIFMANIEAGCDKQIIIKDLVESFGLEISSKSGNGCVQAVATIESIYDKIGYEGLDRVLRLCIGTWEGVPQSMSANMLNGICRLIAAYGSELKDEQFKEKLSQVSCKEISRTAKERRMGSLGYAEAMLLVYNKKSKFGLEWNKLYAKKHKTIDQKDDNPSSVSSNTDEKANIQHEAVHEVIGQIDLMTFAQSLEKTS